MIYNISVLKFAFKRFLLLTKERGVRYSFALAISKRKQLMSMLSIGRGNYKDRSIENTAPLTAPLNSSIKGLVSVIIPIYNRTWELQSAIDSVLSQTYQNIELILVCDGSPEETICVVEQYRNDERVRIFKYPRSSGNAVRGRNKGIIEAHGEYIAFLDSDDIASNNRLELSVSFLNENPSFSGVYGSWKAIVDGSRQVSGIEDGMVVHSPDGMLKEHLENCIPCQSTVMVRRDVLIAVGCINRKMKYREDHELWARLNFHNYRLKSLPDILVSLRLHAGNNELNFHSQQGEDIWYRELLKQYNTRVSRPQKICWIVAGLGISGGLAIIIKHANHLLSIGHDVSLICLSDDKQIAWMDNHVPIYSINDTNAIKNIDLLIATAWNTEPYLNRLLSRRKLYFVQSDERRFIDEKGVKDLIADGYSKNYEYFTEAFWIQKMFHTEFQRSAFYVPNGLDQSLFKSVEPFLPKGDKKRILIEGPIDIPFKAVEDSYNAVKDLDCEIWIVSSAGKPKTNWRYDQFFEKVPMSMMPAIYSSCDIFIKMSRIEGFFGPPLEAMACGCVPVVGKVTGWDEYIVDTYNALAVELGDVDSAKQAVHRLINDEDFYYKLQANGAKTATEWPWNESFRRLDALIERN
ncbi:glycosyltransferase [Aeromonas enteropelogenes]|uniref:glycosyltransferase n=1 Tax=Aeromonas enteropelogenes TaxID=29489 RepID=UPI003BA1170E